MKSFIATSAVLLATCAAALPNPKAARQATNEVTFALSNDQTGHQARGTVPTNGDTSSFSDLFGDSSLVIDGRVLASSSYLTAIPQGTSCDLKDNNGSVFTTLTPEHTYIDLDGDTSVAIPIDVTDYSIACNL